MAGDDSAPEARGGNATVWVDPNEVDPSWAPPSAEASTTTAPDPSPSPSRRSRRLLAVGLPILLVVLAIVAVAAAGGFKLRTDGPVTIEPGEEFTTGPYVYTFERATVQNVQGYGDHPRIEEVIVYGTARNTWTESLSPYAPDEFLGSDETGKVIEGNHFSIDSDSFDGPDKLTPGIAAQPVKVSFEFPPKSTFGDTVKIAVRDLVYENDSVFTSSDQKTWSAEGRRYYRVELPLKRLPREEDW